MKGNVYLSYYSQAYKIENSYKVAVSSWLPSFITKVDKIYNTLDENSYVHVPALSPLNNVRRYKNQDISFDQLIREFTAYIDNKLNSKDEDFDKLLKGFRSILDDGHNITFVCYEKYTKDCHRRVIGDLFKKFGYNIIEF